MKLFTEMRVEGCTVCVRDTDVEEEGQAVEIKCYQWALQISRHEKITNTKVRNRAREKRNLAHLIMERKMNLFGHARRIGHDYLVKLIAFGRMEGKPVRGRPQRVWLDDIMD